MMNVFAGYGFDVWTMDHDGYGYSGSSGNNSDIASGVEDLKAGDAGGRCRRPASRSSLLRQVLGRHPRRRLRPGAARSASTGSSSPPPPTRATAPPKSRGGAHSIDELRANPRRKRDAAMIRSIFTRDGHPGIYDPAVAEALVATEMKFGDTIPSGTYLDMAANLPLVDPTKVMSPVLMTRGEWDGNSTNDDLLDFFRQLPNGDRQFVILPNTAHSPGFSKNRRCCGTR